MGDYTRFAYGEFSTIAAARSVLATELTDRLMTTINKSEREALASVMFKTYSGEVSGNWGVLEWKRDEEHKKDLLYRFVW